MRRLFLAPLLACVAVLSVTSPAAAGPTADLIVAYEDGTLDVREVPVATAGSSIAAAERDPDVAYAELDVPLQATATVTPNDPLYPQQWGPGRTRTNEAWSRTTGASSAVIAVVDTGVDGSHADLSGQVLAGVDCVTDPGRCVASPSIDPGGHGTGVAGVAAARGNDAAGVAGYCWGCKILPVRALDAQGAGSALTVGAGIRWAADNGADVLNLSLSGDNTNATLESAIAYAISKGVMVVAAAGNQTAIGQDLTRRQYPAASPGVIGVVATSPIDTAYTWTYRGSWADVTAPGCALTTVPGGTYDIECGTSFAAPAVAGILGLALSAAPAAPVAAVEAALPATTQGLTVTLAAAGRVDAAALLDTLVTAYPPAPVAPPAAAPAPAPAPAPKAPTTTTTTTPPTTATVERVAGADRVATAVALSKRREAAETVIIARADSYADALAASPLAGKLAAPVLLTGSRTLASTVADEVRRLGATTALLVGGTGALSTDVETGLRQAGATTVRRFAGVSRYDTARLIAEEVGGDKVFLTQASGWADAVAVSGLAALSQAPILLVDRDSVPAVTAQALTTLGATTRTVIGGPGVVSDAVLRELGADRIAGANRYETSAAVAAVAVASGGDSTKVWVATGADWPDALAAGPASAAAGAVLRLVDGRNPGSTTTLTGLTSLVVVGGEASVTSVVFDLLSALLR